MRIVAGKRQREKRAEKRGDKTEAKTGKEAHHTGIARVDWSREERRE